MGARPEQFDWAGPHGDDDATSVGGWTSGRRNALDSTSGNKTSPTVQRADHPTTIR